MEQPVAAACALLQLARDCKRVVHAQGNDQQSTPSWTGCSPNYNVRLLPVADESVVYGARRPGAGVRRPYAFLRALQSLQKLFPLGQRGFQGE